MSQGDDVAGWQGARPTASQSGWHGLWRLGLQQLPQFSGGLATIPWVNDQSPVQGFN